MAILGIDYGSKKIGLARSDDQNKMALPLEILLNTSKSEVLVRLEQIFREHQIKTIVVGVPVSFQNGGKKTFWRQVDLQNQQMKEVLWLVMIKRAWGKWLKIRF